MAVHSLVNGADRVLIDLERGTKVVSAVLGGRERVVTQPLDPGVALPAIYSGMFVMAPWVGRLGRGLLPWEGRTLSFEPNLDGHAIHGLVYDTPWTLVLGDDHVFEAAVDLDSVGWPFGGSVRHRIVLGEGELECTLEVVAGDERMPAAAGWHPWFTRPPGDDIAVTVAADGVLELVDMLPTGRVEEIDGARVLDGAAVGLRHLDDCYVGVAPPATLEWSDLELRIDFSSRTRAVVVYSPDGAVCVEPQTAWPDAPKLETEGVDTGLATLEPGERLAITQSWTWSPRGESIGSRT